MNLSYLTMSPLKAKEHLTKLLLPNRRSPLLVAGEGSSRESPNIQLIAIILGCPPKVKGKSLFLKTACISDSEPRGLRWNSPKCLLPEKRL